MSDRELFVPERTFGKPPSKDSVQRIKQLPEKVDVGTQVVGSHHSFHIADLHNMSAHKFVASLQTKGAREFQPHIRSLLAEVGPHAKHPLDVFFMPERRGSFDGVLDVTLQNDVPECGPDGTETYSVKLVGAAKHSDDLPPAAERPTEPRMANEKPVAEAHVEDPSSTEKGDVTFYFNAATSALNGVARRQGRGIDTVENSAKDYKPAPTDAFWSVLADVALAMGLGAIAGAVGKSLAKKLMERMKTDVKSTTTFLTHLQMS